MYLRFEQKNLRRQIQSLGRNHLVQVVIMRRSLSVLNVLNAFVMLRSKARSMNTLLPSGADVQRAPTWSLRIFAEKQYHKSDKPTSLKNRVRN